MMPDQPDNNRILTNAGRCVVCGKVVDMQDEGHELVIMEQTDIDHPDVSREDANRAMAEALRREGSPESHMLADAYENDEELVMHSECHDKTALPDMYASDEELEDIGYEHEENVEDLL